jgi:hypothetical protein
MQAIDKAFMVQSREQANSLCQNDIFIKKAISNYYVLRKVIETLYNTRISKQRIWMSLKILIIKEKSANYHDRNP